MRTPKIVSAIALLSVLGVPAWSADHATKDEAIAMVKKAVGRIKEEGADKAYTEFDKKGGAFTDRDLYVVVYGMDGKVLAHGANAKMIGKNMADLQDVDGKYFIRERLALAQHDSSFWQNYKFTDPETKKIEAKQMYCERLAETIVCGGVYRTN